MGEGEAFARHFEDVVMYCPANASQGPVKVGIASLRA